ncbi:MAG: tRNA (adenosine(37)-N6)-threonylcarbamoyltransferase complex transferase subunit TsaD, partial [Chitinivibrionales bacterium]|nr:tRNA (adenosine(37)-N6)-threonylcarbamoyltransferase complex transferase subunit TsaD [Chitinivibrionales bacterium]MBD3395641.1 tRNA (adenosine(37)-N6)-threonylcarbamoyltransferase complex transferase subunit TsaD [Chitinivibrionales bacterium]
MAVADAGAQYSAAALYHARSQRHNASLRQRDHVSRAVRAGGRRLRRDPHAGQRACGCRHHTPGQSEPRPAYPGVTRDNGIVLGIETSCDETSVALVRDNDIIANAVFTQEQHSLFGGVVPEIASREHIKKIAPLCRGVLDRTATAPRDLSLIAVTDSPGLAGALLVGISYALGVHCSWGVPVIGVNHLEGHIVSVTLENPALQFPFVALVVSGGHTALYHVAGYGDYRCLGRTIDDAAGEAFDKVGKLLGFGYPAGRAIEQEAAACVSADRIGFPVARLDTRNSDFSFSGLKTAVMNLVRQQQADGAELDKPLLAKSVQEAIVDTLATKALR